MTWLRTAGGFELRNGKPGALAVIVREPDGWRLIADATIGPWPSWDAAMRAVEERVRARAGQGTDA